MKNKIISWTTWIIVGIAGVAITSQSSSFGWPKAGGNLDFVIRIHAGNLIAAGVGLLAACVYIRDSHQRITALEKSIKEIKEKS